MWLDVVDLQEFYADPLGGVARRMIGRHLRETWPDVAGMNVLGIGFPTPYLNVFRGEASRVIAAMPASQGVLHWPNEGPGQTILTDEAELPLPDLSIDRVVLIHAVECSEAIRPMMREIWRVLSGSGRVIVIAPNRGGIWSRLERTPFGYGRPYSQSQLTRLLRDTMFTPITKRAALYVPPSRLRMVMSSAPVWENIGQRWLKIFSGAVGGVVSIEASKQIYAATPTLEASRRHGYATVPNQ
ncbi:MAG: methyltransferase domain-containing protein [Rhodospirillales bacterium]|nr:methyltransferase domain-containing protein [Rhodospirillales bacterium]